MSTAVLKFVLPVALVVGIAYVTTRDPSSDLSIEAQAATSEVTDTADLVEIESRANTRIDALASAPSSTIPSTAHVVEPALLPTSQVAAAIVEDRATGAPVAGATVARYPTAFGLLAGDRAWDVIDTSEADGRLEVLIDPAQPDAEERPGPFRDGRDLFAFASPEYGISFAPLTEEYSPPKLPRLVRLSRAAGVKGRVHGAGVDGVDAISIELTTNLAWLLQEGGSTTWSRDVVWRCAVDQRGTFAFDGLPPGVRFEARVLTRETELWEVPDGLRFAPGEAREVDWVIGAGSTIRVTATEESGGPAVGVQIALDVLRQRGWRYGRGLTKVARKVLTDTSGQAVFTGVLVGNWTLIVTEDQPSLRDDMRAQVELDELNPARHGALANVPANVLHEVDVTRDDDTYVLDLTVYRGHYIRGQVVDWEGSPAECAVSARSDENGVKIGQRNSDGRFRIGPMLPGEYELKARPKGRGADVSGETILARTGDTDVVLRLGRGSRLKGKVVDRGSGKPLPARISYEPGVGGVGNSGTSGESGLFDIGKIRPGAFSLLVKTEDGRVALHEYEGLTPGEERQDIRIEVGERTQIDVHYGGAHRDVMVVLETKGIHLGQKRISVETPALLPVSPGVIDVEAFVRAEDRSWTLIAKRAVTIIEGDTLRVDISEP